MPNEVHIVHLTRDELTRIVSDAAAEGYRRAAVERERHMARLADRLDAPAVKGSLTTREAAAYASVSPETVLRWIADGMKAKKRGRGYRIRRSDLDDWLTR